MNYQELRKALVSKGQAHGDRTGAHVFFYIAIEGRSYRATKLSHSAKGQISSSLLGEISKQMRLTAPELRHFVDCTIEREEWFQLWRQRGASWKR